MAKNLRAFDPIIDNKNWQRLMKLHFEDLRSLNAISSIWQEGYVKLPIELDKVPSASELTEAIKPHTGYTFIPSKGPFILEQIDWYRMISEFKMPLTCFLRTPEELAYCDEPDLWHDIMGHIPFLAQKEYSDMYQLLADTYIKAYDQCQEQSLRALDFIGGMLIELGLIKENSIIKAFGATFYSSSEVMEAFKSENQILLTKEDLYQGDSYNRHRIQGKYYVFNSIEELVELIKIVRNQL